MCWCDAPTGALWYMTTQNAQTKRIASRPRSRPAGTFAGTIVSAVFILLFSVSPLFSYYLYPIFVRKSRQAIVFAGGD